VTRKFSLAVAKIKLNLMTELRLGNLDAKRDWGYAPDYVRGMWLMLQHDKPDDYVLATGETYSIREFVMLAFRHVGLNWEKYVATDEKLYRPAEVNLLQGDWSKAKKLLGWQPEVKLQELVKIMVNADIEFIKNNNQNSDELTGYNKVAIIS
jgi:GDPmannose 4,6-dehydratase